MTEYTDPPTQTVIVRTNLPAHVNRALDHMAIDLRRSKSTLLVEAARNLLALHGRGVDVSMPGGGQ